MGRVLAVVIVVALVVYALIEVAQAEGGRIRAMPRWLWVVAIVALPGLGALGWLLLGRPVRATGPTQRPPSPDDDIDFLRGL